MAATVVIPARWGSSRFPGKPLVLIGGKPMIQRVMEQAAAAPGVGLVAAATDDQRIADAVESFGGRALMITERMRTGSDRVAAAARLLGLAGGDIVVNVQGDQPLLPPQVVARCVEALEAEPALGMATPVMVITRPEEVTDPNHVKVVMDRAGRALYFSRAAVPLSRDGDPATFYKHLGVYAYRNAFLQEFAAMASGELEQVEKLEQLRSLEHGRPVQCVVTHHDSPEVDRPQDAERIEALLRAGA